MVIITSKEYNSGLLLSEYNGKLGIMYGFQNKKTDKFEPFWVYRQASYKAIPLKKAMPHQVGLGTPQQAKIILQKFLDAIDEEFLDKKEEKE